MLSFAQFLWKCVQFWNSHKLYIEALDSSLENPMFPVNTKLETLSVKHSGHSRFSMRASVLPFQKCVNSVSGFANSVFYRFRLAKFRFLPFQIFKIPFNFFQAVFWLSIIFVFKIVSVSAF